MNLPFVKKAYYTLNYQTGEELDVRLFSDLHLEFDDSFTIPNLKPNQVVILAGDIHVKHRGIPWIKTILEKGNHVVYVDGNHEFYHTTIDKVKRLYHALDSEYENFHYLDDSSVFINDVEFLGGTLWTDMDNENPNVYIPLGEKRFDRYSTDGVWDYRHIYLKRPNQGKDGQDVYNVLKTKDTVNFHKKTIAFLKERAGKHPVQFVVTHHTPHEIFLDRKRNRKSKVHDFAYYTDLHYLANQFSYWAAGHTHKKVFQQIDNVLYLSNPRGYHDTKDPDEDLVAEFDPNLIIKIKTT
jgi:predicted phosphodiesterase